MVMRSEQSNQTANLKIRDIQSAPSKSKSQSHLVIRPLTLATKISPLKKSDKFRHYKNKRRFFYSDKMTSRPAENKNDRQDKRILYATRLLNKKRFWVAGLRTLNGTFNGNFSWHYRLKRSIFPASLAKSNEENLFAQTHFAWKVRLTRAD